MEEKRCLNRADEQELATAYKILQKLSEHDLPVVRFNCRKAKNELWQALFELDLLDESGPAAGLGLLTDG
ncbi:MAG: hypothetical protein ACE5JU_03190 [Candidatus Binatia bacterium]